MGSYKSGGKKALLKEMKALMDQNPARYYAIMFAFFPRKMSEVARDVMAAMGVTGEEAEEIVKSLNSPTTKQ
jgi:hypothetical protein